jgi:hypothetical protein
VKRVLLIFFLFVAATTAGCGHGEDEQQKMSESVTDEIPKEIQIPSKLWDFIEGKADPDFVEAEHAPDLQVADGGHGEDTGDHGGGGGSEGSFEAGSGGALFVPVDVILTEKNPGVLSQSPIRIRLPRGGGAVDLAQYTTERQGSFFVRFEWPDQEGAGSIESWFVSKARKRKLGSEMWGAGCQSFFRITKGLAKAQSGEGLKVNTTRLRHLTVLGGHFIFSSRKSGQTSVSQVTFRDSRYPQYFCEGF